MSKVFLKWDTNWADEMDVEGTAIMDKKEWEDYRESVSKIKRSFDIYVGSNEEIEYSNGDALLREITAREMTDEEAKVVSKFVGMESGFTQFLRVVNLIDYDEDDEDDENEEDEFEDWE